MSHPNPSTDRTPSTVQSRYRPALSGPELTAVVAALRTIPATDRTNTLASALKKLATLAAKIELDLVAPAYTATATATASTDLATPKLNKAELATATKASDSAANLAEWAYCWQQYCKGVSLAPSEVISALEHVYLNFTVPNDLVLAMEHVLNEHSTMGEPDHNLSAQLLAEIKEVVYKDTTGYNI